MAEGDELPRGVRGHTTPGNFINEYALRCDLVHFECKVNTQYRTEFVRYHVNVAQAKKKKALK